MITCIEFQDLLWSPTWVMNFTVGLLDLGKRVQDYPHWHPIQRISGGIASCLWCKSSSWKFRVSIMLNSSLYFKVVYFFGLNSDEVAMWFAHFCWARCPESVYKGSCALLCKLLIFSNLGWLPNLFFNQPIHNFEIKLCWADLAMNFIFSGR